MDLRLPRPRLTPPVRRVLIAAALSLATASLSVALTGTAQAAHKPASHKPPSHKPASHRHIAAPLLGHRAPKLSAAASATLSISATSVPNGANFAFSYSVPSSDLSTTNWIGIYEPGQTPGVQYSTTYEYTPDTTTGTVTFSSTSLDGVGQYVAYLFYDNGYQILAGPVDFAVLPSRPAPAPSFAGSFGQQGPGALTKPAGIALGRDGSIWVTDAATGQVEQFSQSGTLLQAFGGQGPGRLVDPTGIAVDSQGNVWVSDTGNDSVAEFSPAGRELTSFGSAGSGNGQLDQPEGIAIEGGNIYVADQGNNRVEEFSPSGSYLNQISVGSPQGITFDSAGDLWVASPNYAIGNAVYEFAPDGSQLQIFYATQASYGAFSNPAYIAVGPDGRVYVTQPDYGLVTVLNPDGSFYTEFGLQADPADAGQDLSFPNGIAIAPDGTVYVADTGNGRIVRFAPPSAHRDTAAAAAPPSAVPWHGIAAGIVLLSVLGAIAVAMSRRRKAGNAAQPAAGSSPAPAPSGLVVSRRSVLTGATALTGAAVGAAVLPLSLRRALAKTLAYPQQGSISDIQHIVILMQENRSFDHYYGTMPGVRGFADPTAITLPTGNPVFYQPDPSHAQGYLLPFYYNPSATSAQATPGTDHTWPTQHQAWDNGKMDQWIAAKGEYTMGYFKQQDIPFHWALAESFTICDNYHCSVFGPTNPNRLYMWTGMIDPNGTGGGPIIDNSPAFNNIILSWTTYPERLQAAGISWKVYQEEDNYDDNALAWFKQYGYAPTSSPLWQRGMYKGQAGDFEMDARNDRLPQVSWIVAPTAQTEHPDYFPAAGAEYIAQKLDAIASNPDVWAKTAFILCYDENDGMFDHVPPPVAPAGTPDEFVDGLNIGLGFRTPTTIVSPWTAGGYVASEVFDHTSLIRFIEARFGVYEPNISAWRRQTCGDLTSAFRFAGQPAGFPQNGQLGVAFTESRLLRAQQQVNDNPFPVPPAVNEPLPTQ